MPWPILEQSIDLTELHALLRDAANEIDRLNATNVELLTKTFSDEVEVEVKGEGAKA